MQTSFIFSYYLFSCLSFLSINRFLATLCFIHILKAFYLLNACKLHIQVFRCSYFHTLLKFINTLFNYFSFPCSLIIAAFVYLCCTRFILSFVPFIYLSLLLCTQPFSMSSSPSLLRFAFAVSGTLVTTFLCFFGLRMGGACLRIQGLAASVLNTTVKVQSVPGSI